MTLTNAIQRAAVRMRYLAVLTGNVLLRGWIVHSANAYKVPSSYSFTSLAFNTTALTLRASIALVEANAGSWFQDVDGTVYVKPPAAQDIYAAALVAKLNYYFAKESTIVDTQYYEGRLASVPALSLRIEPRFSGVGQVGTGSCSFRNEDGFFAEKTDIRWLSVQFSVGADTPTSTASAGEYVPFGFWKVADTQRNGSQFQMNLVEPKAALQNKTPIETYTRAAYPAIGDNDVGKPIPRIYGKVFGITPVCVDPTAKRFKVAGHAVYEFSEIRIFKDNVWTTITFATTTPASGEFTLGAEWANNETVSIDVIGRTRVDGRPMFNASEIVQDILLYLGETNLDASFDSSFDSLDVGEFEGGLRRTLFKPSLYIDSATPAIDIIGKINSVAGSFLYINETGQWHYEVFEPKQLANVDNSFTDQDIAAGTMNNPADPRDVFSKVNVKFAERIAEKWAQSEIAEDTSIQYLAGAGSSIVKEITAPLFDRQDVIYYAQRLLTTEGQPLQRIPFAVFWKGILIKPGHQIAVSSDRLKIYGILEVLEARHDLDNNRVNLVCGDRRGWADSFGFWVADTEPDWNAAATSTEKREASEGSGYWQGDDSLANSTDPKSFQVSRLW